MYRTLEIELLRWKNQPTHLPLILRGARQVGKSYLVEKLGRDHFHSIVTINFELQPSYADCFDSLDPQKILQALEILTKSSIIPGETLLFLDEIQACPKAIQSLRYFKEKIPSLHVIGAGSLLEFVLQEEKFSFPVGRVQFLYLKPLSFQEYLLALNDKNLIEFLSKVTLNDPPSLPIHQHALQLFRQYLLIGGMPAAMQAFLNGKSFLEARRVHQLLLQAYQSDFGKYSTKSQFKHLQRFFERAPRIVGSHFKYVEINPEARSRDLKTALRQLSWAGLIHPVHETKASGIPLKSQVNENKFKLLFLDVGLLQTSSHLDIEVLSTEEITQIRAGAIAEQAVGQELMAYSDCYEPPGLYFWKREKKNSEAEVDYVIQVGTGIYPIEVKAVKTGHLKSLKRFIEEKKSPFGVRISSAPLSFENRVLSVPFYLIHQLEKLIKSIV